MTSSVIGTGSMNNTIQALAAVIWWLLILWAALLVVFLVTFVVFLVRERWEDRDAQRRIDRLLEREQSRVVANCLQAPALDELDRIWALPPREPQ